MMMIHVDDESKDKITNDNNQLFSKGDKKNKFKFEHLLASIKLTC